MTKTKIICTIGPAVSSYEGIIDLINAGMNIARLNFSHGSHEEHIDVINKIKKARDQLKTPMAIMLDTKGPEIRLGEVKNGSVEVEVGHQILLTSKVIEGDKKAVSINPAIILEKLHEGTVILFNDGYVSAHVVKVVSDGVLIEIDNKGILKSKGGVNVPDVAVDLPALTEQDIADIRFGCDNDIDIIAASFIRCPEDVLAIKKLINEASRPDILIIAKIENKQGVEHFDSILQVSDGIMVARGDLGVELPLSQVPRLQKMMIRQCCLAGKPVVTATQMLESMIQNPRPTRAEASDVANAIYDSTSAVMLSAETAVGKYPCETVQVMRSIISEAEKDLDYPELFFRHSQRVYNDVASSVTLAAVKTANTSNAKAIFACTSHGVTAALLARLRPKMSIIALTSDKKVYHQLSLIWGVIPFFCEGCHSMNEAYDRISEFSLERGYVHYGDLVVFVAGSPFGESGTTNTIIVESIGDVLVRGFTGYGKRIHAPVTLVLSPEKMDPASVAGKILVTTRFDDAYIPFVRYCVGIILQNRLEDSDSEKRALSVAKALDKSLIVRADAACKMIKEAQLVTMDPARELVFKGIIEEE